MRTMIDRIAKAIHAARIEKDPTLNIPWEDCIDEAKAAYDAMWAGKPTYDPNEDFSHLEPI